MREIASENAGALLYWGDAYDEIFASNCLANEKVNQGIDIAQ